MENQHIKNWRRAKQAALDAWVLYDRLLFEGRIPESQAAYADYLLWKQREVNALSKAYQTISPKQE